MENPGKSAEADHLAVQQLWGHPTNHFTLSEREWKLGLKDLATNEPITQNRGGLYQEGDLETFIWPTTG